MCEAMLSQHRKAVTREIIMGRIKYRYYKVAAVLVGEYQTVQYRVAIMTYGFLCDPELRLSASRMRSEGLDNDLLRRFVFEYSGPTYKVNGCMGSNGLRDHNEMIRARESVESWFKRKARNFAHKLEDDIIWVQLSLTSRLYTAPSPGDWLWRSEDSQLS